MNILITGNNGYIGPVLYKEIKKKISKSKIFGLDTNYFKIKNFSDTQLNFDLRDFPKKIFNKKFESIIHLASISNDPIGNKYEKQTEQINIKATKKLIDQAKKMDVNRLYLHLVVVFMGKMEIIVDMRNPRFNL